MKKFLRLVLRIHTLKFILFNPEYFATASILDLAEHTVGVLWVACDAVEDMKIIDTQIPIKIKKRK